MKDDVIISNIATNDHFIYLIISIIERSNKVLQRSNNIIKQNSIIISSQPINHL
jgi:hypothetical protein